MPVTLNSKPKCASTSTNGCGVRVGTLCTFTLDCTSLQFYMTVVSCDIAWQQQITKLRIMLFPSKRLNNKSFLV